MITHSSHSRGEANHGWLQSHFTFSFADYYNPERMNFGALRVINDDIIAPGSGFPTHAHRDMEIITIPLEGVLQHKDNQGNSYRIQKGEVQVMSAGTGIAHSEFNPLLNEEVKLLQIWVFPKELDVRPRYDQKLFDLDARRNRFQLVVSPDGQQESLTINQDAFFSLCEMDAGSNMEYLKFHEINGVYIFVISGELKINGVQIATRDGVGITEDNVALEALSPCEILVMEVPMEI